MPLDRIFSSAARQRLSRLQLVLILLLCLAAGLPGILARYPQMTDYPAHLARWYIMIDGGRTPDLAKYYSFRWVWSGNLGADLLIRPLAALFGLETAGRLLVIVVPMLVAGGLFAVEWTLRRRIGVGSLLALATVWSPALLMGFLNFELALAGALYAFALWVRMEGNRWRGPLFVPIGALVWLAHQSGWGVLGVMVFGYEWSRQDRQAGHWSGLWAGMIQAGLATWPLWLPLLPTILASHEARGAFDYGRRPLKVKWAFWTQALRDRVRLIDYGTTILLLVLPIIAFWARRLDFRLAVGGVLTLLLSLAIPRHLGGGDLADLRLIAVGLMLLALAIDWRPAWALMWLAVLPFAVRLAITSAVWTVHSANVSYMMKALDQIPRGARVAVAVREEVGLWAQPLYGHLGCYATLRRDALVNNHFAIPGVHMLTLTPAAWKWVDPSHRIYARAGRSVKLSKFKPAKEAEYLWYFGKYAPADLPPGAQVIFRSRHSLLAKLANPPIQR